MLRGRVRAHSTEASAAEAHRRRNPDDLEVEFQAYIKSSEYLTFKAVVEMVERMPPMGQLAERRADFEFLLFSLHRLGREFHVEHASKSYRSHYSPDVQLSGYLFSTLLTAFTLLPSYVLNGQEFLLSDTVLEQCQSLQQVYQETCCELKKQFGRLQPFSIEHIRSDVRRSLMYFDRSWCRFEMPALEEIEAIHRQACRPLIEAIDAEKALVEFERQANAAARGSAASGSRRLRSEVQRERLMEKFCELNQLANIDGKGRGDMDLTPVLAAERIVSKPMCACRERGSCALPHRCNGCASPVLLRVARCLLRSFDRLRCVLQKYAQCLYQLNSHLANNADLVRGLELLENSWDTASSYLVKSAPRRLALQAYDIVTKVNDENFQSALRSLDPGFLVASLPRALLFYEMRFSSEKVSLIKVSQIKDGDAQVPTMLPRPFAGRSAFRHSRIARTFLPQDLADVYNATAATLDELSPDCLAGLHSALISASSNLSTPLQPSPLQRPKPPTPCLPRIAVPQGPLAMVQVKSKPDDDDVFPDLVGLQAQGDEFLARVEKAGHVDTQCALSRISTLALHLQRNSANEWNELVQVVLQGVLLADSLRGTNTVSDVW